MDQNHLQPPYYVVIFSAQRTLGDNGYDATAERMAELSASMPGFLGMEHARGDDGFGITVCYWDSEEAIANWKSNVDHVEAQSRGASEWYADYRVRIGKVTRAYGKSEMKESETNG
ncbi:MAG: antibiotic biosynthesis monooxygenase [Pseudomonadota bacterium]